MRRVLHAVPPAWLGYRWIRRQSVRDYVRETGSASGAAYDVVHPEGVASNPLPANVDDLSDLPATRGWWGYAFRDVPARTSGETFIATVPHAHIACYSDETRAGDFYPAIVAGRSALDLREIRFRPRHAEVLRRAQGVQHLPSATWVIERVYHNHSHWLTAHLPKLLLLRRRGELDDVVLPAVRTPVMDASMRLAGLNPDRFPTFDPGRPLSVDRLRIVGTDRFRPELLRLVPEACGIRGASGATRKVFISRQGAARRRLVNEDAIWPDLQAAGFERVRLEDLPFDEQVALMKTTRVLFAPHGAGLTNMLFCPPGCEIVEIADLSFPNPNFYALASALGHRYWLLAGEGMGEGRPIDKDLRVDPSRVSEILRRLPA